MRFRRGFWRLLPLAIVFLVPFTTPVSYTTARTAGVSVGNSFKHTVAFSWSSIDPNATMPSYLASLNETEWMSISIIDVSGTNVTAQITTHLKNGTDQVWVGLTDVDIGNGNWTTWIIAANLNPNDTIYSIYSTLRINETITREYPGGSRNTNHLNITTELNTTDSYQYTSRNNYWDRETGFMVEAASLQVSRTNTFWENVSFVTTLTESDVWVVPEFPALTPILAVFISLTAAVVLYIDRSSARSLENSINRSINRRHKQRKMSNKRCGNCTWHGAWVFPSKVFCELRFRKEQNYIHDTLDVCDNWESMNTECTCVEECKRLRRKDRSITYASSRS